MSLDDFFAKKSKKKTKSKIDTQQLFEQIIENPQPQRPEVEKKLDILTSITDETEDWEPILNDDIELDFSNVRINDLSVVNNEQDQSALDAQVASNKLEDSKVAWGSKQTPAEPPKTEECSKEEAPGADSSKTSAYVAPHLRAAGGRIHSMQAQPNLESTEEFPTLDAAKEKPKKVRTPEKIVVDTSWTEVNKTSKGHRMDDSSATGGGYVPPSLRKVADNQSKYAPPSSKESYSQSLERRCQGAPAQEKPVSQGWSRGDLVRNKAPVVQSPALTEEGKSSVLRGVANETSKPYVPPHQRDILQFKQENRFAQLDDA